MYLFTGQRDHKIDGKDRIVIPSQHAGLIAAQAKGVVYLVPGPDGGCIEAYPGDIFEAMAAGQIPNRFDGDLARKRSFFANAERCELTGPGRITIPDRFLALFPRREVRVCGFNTYLELWDPGRWDVEVGSGIRVDGGKPPPKA